MDSTIPKKTFIIFRNFPRGTLPISALKTIGTCCWKVCNFRRKKCETYKPGTFEDSKVVYISEIIGHDCPNNHPTKILETNITTTTTTSTSTTTATTTTISTTSEPIETEGVDPNTSFEPIPETQTALTELVTSEEEVTTIVSFTA